MVGVSISFWPAKMFSAHTQRTFTPPPPGADQQLWRAWASWHITPMLRRALLATAPRHHLARRALAARPLGLRAMSSSTSSSPSAVAAAASAPAPSTLTDEGPTGDILWQLRGIETSLPAQLRQALSRVNMSQAELNQLEVHEAIKQWQRFEGDCGSPEVVTAILTCRIGQLAKHMKEHRKDTQVKRRLVMLVHKRNRQLRYLRRKDRDAYDRVLEGLRIRPSMAFDPTLKKRPVKKLTKKQLVLNRKRRR